MCGVLLQISPHLLVFWRPDVKRYRAFIIQEAKPGTDLVQGFTPMMNLEF